MLCAPRDVVDEDSCFEGVSGSCWTNESMNNDSMQKRAGKNEKYACNNQQVTEPLLFLLEYSNVCKTGVGCMLYNKQPCNTWVLVS